MTGVCLRVGVLAAFVSTAVLAESLQPRVDLVVSDGRVSMEELARLLPVLDGIELPPHIRIAHLEAHGPIGHVNVRFRLQSPAGSLNGQAVVDARAPVRAARGSITLENFNVRELADRPPLPAALDATVEFNLRFHDSAQNAVSGTFELQAPEITAFGYTAQTVRAAGRIADGHVTFDATGRAYGGAVETHGSAALAGPLTYELRGSASGVNLARLPAALDLPRTSSDVSLRYTVSGSQAGATGQLVLRQSEIAGATVGANTTVSFDTRGEGLTLDAKGALADVSVERIAEMFNVDALEGAGFNSALDVSFDVQMRGGTLQALTASVDEGRIFGGSIRELIVTANPSDAGLAFSARGRFAEVDPGAIVDRPELEGRLTGSLDITGLIPRAGGELVAERLDVRGRVALESSVVEGVPVQQGAVAFALSNGTRLDIERGEFVAPALEATLAGTVGLEASVFTDLRYEVTSQSLSTFSDLAGQSLSGSGTLRGTVQGAELLKADGTLEATKASYGDLVIDELSAEYSARFSRGFEAPTLAFTIDARESERTIGTSGRVTWHPDHREIHLDTFTFDTPAGTWQLAEGTSAAIQYGDARLAFDDVRLTAAPNQFIRLDGALGDARTALRIAAGNVQLSPWASLVSDWPIAGELTTNAVVTGTLKEPLVNGEFEVRSASVRDVAFETLTGEASLGAKRLTFDMRLVRPDGSWLVASGGVPAALVTGDDAASGAPVTINVTSSPIALEIVSAFTDAVTDVTGTLQVDANWEGTLARPELQGQIAVLDGAFRVPALGTQYHGLDTVVLLQPDNLVVDQARIVDDDDDWLMVSGRLPIGELLMGEVQLQVQAESFEVMDNAAADLEVNANLEVSGNLRRPSVAGLLEIANGQVHVAQVLELSGGETDGVASPAVSPEAPGRNAAEGLLANVPIALDVHMRADDLLLAGRDLHAPGNVPIGLGNINVVADGDLTLQKTREGPLRVRGDVRLTRGTYEFQGREFELTRGSSIRFIGDPDVNPSLDVTAVRTISAVETRVHVGGTLEDPSLQLSSSPPLDPADVLSLIVFNQPTIQLGAGARVSLAQRAAAIGAGFLAGEISDAISAAFGLDIVDIDAGRTANGGFAPVVTIGEQFGDLFLKVRQQVGAESTSEVVLEYSVTDWFSIESSIVDRRQNTRPSLRRLEGSGIDGVFSWEFGGPAEDAAAERQSRGTQPGKNGERPARPQ